MKRLSIIIPVYNNWNFTEKCLESVFLNTRAVNGDFEVIVVDDNSKDGTYDNIRDFTSQKSNVVYLRNEDNLGFSGSCNRGAANAAGEYLIFLNNDTVVTKDWAEQLLNTISKNRDIWMVGAKCLYPDGTLQHAGVAFPDHFRFHLGHIYRNAPEHFPLADHEKDYQCVTAACMIIRKEDFNSLGGFDEAYKNGFEDVDLCLKITEKGKRIRYQPECRIYHYESKSESRFEKMKENKKILLERWENKIKPDETQQIESDIERSLKKGTLRKLYSQNDKTDKNSIEITGNYKIKKNSIHFYPGNENNSIKIQLPENTDDDYLLIKGQTGSEKDGHILLRYFTQNDQQISNGKLFSFRLYKGRNNFYFPLFKKFLTNHVTLDFSFIKTVTEVKEIEVYSFNNGKKRSSPGLTIISYGRCNQQGIFSLMDEIGSFPTHFSRIDMYALCYDDWNKNNPENIPGSERISFSFNKCRIEELTSYFNKIIEGSDNQYICIVPDNMVFDFSQAIKAIEMMETNPEAGMFYGVQSEKSDEVHFDKYLNAYLLSSVLDEYKDLPVIVKKDCLKDAGMFDESLEYFFSIDLCLAIISVSNWLSFAFQMGEKVAENDQIPIKTYTRLKQYQEMVKKKHAGFLLDMCMNSPDKQRSKIKRYYVNSYHNTLLGSLKAHFSHFVRHRIMRRRSIRKDSHKTRYR